MKSPKVKGIGEVVTEYGAKVMKIFKKGLLGRSLFDFYGDVKAQTFRTKESASVPSTPSDGAGGIMYTKSADGKLYYKSNEISEVELSSSGATLTTEEVQDIAGALAATGGTKTGITVTYQDGTGDMDFVVDHDAASNFVAEEHVDWAASGAGTIHTDNYIENVVQTTVSGSSGTVTSIGNLTGDVTSSNRATTIAADAVTYAKMQDVSATNVVLGRDSAGAGIVEEISAANLRTIINVEDGATADQTKSDINGLAITTVGTIGTGVWQGTAIASNYLDSDTAHLSGVQTFLGPRTFAAGIIYDGDRNATPGDGAAIHVDSSDITDNNTSASGTVAAFNHVSIENPRVMATNASVTTTDAATVFIKGAPVASTNQTITNAWALRISGGAVDISTVTAGTWQGTPIASAYIADDAITQDKLANPQELYVKILPSDFMPDDGGRPAMIDDTSGDRWLESHGTLKLFAFVEIPSGFKATLIDIYGSATSAITVYEADVNSATVTSKGTGNIGTQINITDVTADATNYIMIELAQASGEKVYGGSMTIAAV